MNQIQSHNIFKMRPTVILDSPESWYRWYQNLVMTLNMAECFEIVTGDITIDNAYKLYGLSSTIYTDQRNIIFPETTIKDAFPEDEGETLRIQSEWERRNSYALKSIYETVSVPLKGLINKFKNASDAYATLKLEFARDLQILFDKVMTDLIDYKFRFGGNLNIFFNKQLNLWHIIQTYESEDFKLPDRFLSMIIKRSMPREFHFFIFEIENSGGAKDSVDLRKKLSIVYYDLLRYKEYVR